MKFINKYNNIEDYNGDVNRPIYNTVSYIKNEGRIIYTPRPSHIEFADPEVIRVLRDQVGLAFEGNKAKLSDIEEVNTFNEVGWEEGSYFFESNIVTFRELKYFIGLTELKLAFEGCSLLLDDIIIPNSVTSLENTFDSCSSLTTAPIIPEGVTNLSGTFNYCESLTTAPAIPSSVTDLSYTFYGCSSLTIAPVIPSSVTDLSNTFRNCSSIDGIYIINPVTPPTFNNSLSNVQTIYVPDASVSAYKTASGWSEFADKIYPFSEGPFELGGKFADPEVGRVLHANGLIASPTHSTREELATITSLNPSNNHNTSYFYNNKVITQFPELQYCTGLTSLRGTFNACSKLITAPVIPSSVTDLSYTFYNCPLTIAPVIPEGVTNMVATFGGCADLLKAPVIPSSVTDLSETFDYCMSLDGIYIINAVTPPTYNQSLGNLEAIYVPDASVDAYKSASGWSFVADKIYPMSDKPQ